jgi:stalled ribosome rescue protein Dom34
MSAHTAVWLDHREARVFAFHPAGPDEATVHAPPHNDHHKWTRGQEGTKEHPEDTKKSFRELIASLQATEKLLIVGPGTAKGELASFIKEFDPALDKKIVGVETVDHPTDGQIVAFAKTYFARVDHAGITLA